MNKLMFGIIKNFTVTVSIFTLSFSVECNQDLCPSFFDHYKRKEYNYSLSFGLSGKRQFYPRQIIYKTTIPRKNWRCEYSFEGNIRDIQSIDKTIHRAQVKPITGQPQVINSIFGIVPQENVLHEYQCETGGCGCGPTYTVTLTDARLIQRGEECSCCGTGSHIDTMVFLSDISSITDFVVGKGCCTNGCSCGSSCCAGSDAKQIGFTGPFGTLVFTFNVNDLPNALVQIPAAALRHKTSQPQDPSNRF